MRSRTAVLLLLIPAAVFAAGCAGVVKTGPVVDSTRGMVVCVDEIAAQAGAEVLARGGNAVDAAVATALALAVTHPQAGNLGGGGFMVIRTRDREITTIDYREKAPLLATADMYLNPDGTVNEEKARLGFTASGVPGTVAGLYLAQARYGRLRWEQVVQPAVDLAEQGFRVDFDLAAAFRRAEERLRRFPDTVNAYFGPGGEVPRVGDRLVLPDLADTLRAVRDGGREGFYGGPVARELVRAVEEGGGYIRLKDLETYTARERSPVRIRYRDVEVLAMGLPSSGGVVLGEMLNILSGYDLKNLDAGVRAHVMVEAMRRAYKDRALYLGDPEFTTPPLERLLSTEYAGELRAGIDLEHATDSRTLAPGLTLHEAGEAGSAAPAGRGETTHFCVADGEGMVVSNTFTLEQSFGCKAVAGRTGVLLNNEMHDFNLRPGWTDTSGAIGTEPNRIAPGKRMLSSMCPVIVLKDGEPYAAFGSLGGRRIINVVLQVLVNLVDLGMPLGEAVRAPRLHHQWFPDKVYVEKTMPWEVTEALRARGHVLERVERIGDCHALLFERRPWGVTIRGAADTRIDGCAAGL